MRSILNYSIRRENTVEECRRTLDVTAMLQIRHHTPLDPKPIRTIDFRAVHKAAIDAGDNMFATLMLAAINCGMYGGEVSALKWEEVDLTTGELVTRRPKTGVSHVAILWPEVRAALKKLPHKGEHIFHTRVRSYTNDFVHDSWRKYRTAASFGDDIVFGMIRDAAFTIAYGVSLDQAQVLAGHRLPGMTDHYVRRAPGFVGETCLAIHRAFYQ